MTAMLGTQTVLTVNEVDESLENSCIPTAEMCVIIVLSFCVQFR